VGWVSCLLIISSTMRMETVSPFEQNCVFRDIHSFLVSLLGSVHSGFLPRPMPAPVHPRAAHCACWLFAILFDLEDGGSTFFRNVGTPLRNYTASHHTLHSARRENLGSICLYIATVARLRGSRFESRPGHRPS
jgi:hypothetical protein